MCTNYWTIKNLSNNVIIYSKRPQFKIKFSMFISFLKSYCYRIIVRDCNGKVKVSINGDATANWAKFKKCTQCVFLIKLYHPLSWDRDVVSDVFRWKFFFEILCLGMLIVWCYKWMWSPKDQRIWRKKNKKKVFFNCFSTFSFY